MNQIPGPQAEKTASMLTASIRRDERHKRSFLMACLQTLVRPFRPHLVSLPKKPYQYCDESPHLDPPTGVRMAVTIQERQVSDVYVYEFTAHLPAKIKYRPKHDLYYFAGGSFVMPPNKEQWKLCTELTNQLPEYRIHIVSCPLAPTHRASRSLATLGKWALEVCQEADKNNRCVTFAGDSSGANIAMALALHVADTAINDRDRRTQLKNVLLISPVTDQRKNNPEMAEAEKHDPIMTIAHTKEVSSQWIDDQMGIDHPAVSPVLADLTSLRLLGIKVHGVVGTYDVLAPDAIVFRHRLEEFGVSGEWLEWRKQMHCFPLAFIYHLPEAVQGKNWILDVLRNNA